MNHTQGVQCYSCPTGYSCQNKIIPQICVPGFYCPLETYYNLQSCPTGTFSSASGLQDSSECTPCTAGHYCKYPNATDVTGNCKAGYYCHNGSTTATPEIAGNYSSAGICPSGYYCPSGNASAPIAYPRGTFNGGSHGEYVDDCELCEQGYYCETPGLSNFTDVCDAGYYCKRGATVGNPSSDVTVNWGPCPVGTFCPPRTSEPKPCEPGTFNSLIAQAKCLPCGHGYYCEERAKKKTICPEGYYCYNGTKYACPEGTFKNFTGDFTLSQCKACPGGQFCEATAQKRPTGCCEGGWYCGGGSWTSKPIDNEMYNGTWECPLYNISIGGMCKSGTFCPECSVGPIQCTPGYFCQQDELLSESGSCGAGYFCNGSSTEKYPVNKTFVGMPPLKDPQMNIYLLF